MIELHPSPRVVVDQGNQRVFRLLGRVEQLEHTLGRRDPGLQQVGHRRQLRQRLRVLPRVLEERLDVTQAQGAGGDAQATDHCDGDIVQVGDEHHHRLDRSRDELGGEARFEQLLVLGVEGCLGVALLTEHLDQLVTREHLFDLRVERAGVIPLVDEPRPRSARDERDRRERQRDGDDRDQREERRDRDHHHEDADDGEHRREHLAERLLQALREIVDVVRHPAEQVTAGHAIDVAEWKAVELLLHFGPQTRHGALHDPGEHVGLQVRQHGRGDVEAEREQQRAVELREVDAVRALYARRRSRWWRSRALVDRARTGSRCRRPAPRRRRRGNPRREDGDSGAAPSPGSSPTARRVRRAWPRARTGSPAGSAA